MLTCPAPQEVLLNGMCEAVLPDYRGSASKSDNCTAFNDIILTQSPAAATVFSGHNSTQTVTITANDGNGNTTQCNFIVTFNDNSNPIITCPGNQNVSIDDDCPTPLSDYRSTVILEDNCTENAAITLTQSPAAGTIIMGDGTVQPVTITADDGNGNMTECNFTVTLEDTTIPTITCPGPQTLTVDADCESIVPDYRNEAAVSSDCVIGSAVTVTQSPPAGTVLTGHNFMQTVTLVVDDGNGNTNMCSFDVTLEDATAPSITCPADRQEVLNADCEFSISDYTSLSTQTDNCAADAAITVTQNPLVNTIVSGHNNTQTIILTANDGNGNTAQCSFIVTLKDEPIPALTCPTDLTVNTDTNCEFALADYTSQSTTSDNCAAVNQIILTQVPAVGTTITGDLTTQTVTVTANDGNGNTTSCNFIVTLEDQNPPILTCPSDQVVPTDVSCEINLADYTNLVTVADDCRPTGNIILTQSPAATNYLSC